jgi:sugar phosphate isomerase/epimerase
VNRRTFVQSAALAGGALSTARLWSMQDDNAIPNGWKLGVITDEADTDLAHVIRDFIPKYHLHWVEIRDLKFNGKNTYLATQGTQDEVKQTKEQLDRANLKLSVLDTPIYKIALPGTHGHFSAADLHKSEGDYKRQLVDLKRAAGAAHQLGTDKLRIFAFLRVDNPDSVFNRVVDELNKALEIAKTEDVRLVLENESSTNIATGAETAKLFKTITDQRLCHNWDPGNAFDAGETPYPDGWDKLDKSRICHMHLKDAVRVSATRTKWMPIGKGQIDYAGQFRALKQVGYSNTMSLETHYKNAQHDPWTSSVESMDGLIGVMRQTANA